MRDPGPFLRSVRHTRPRQLAWRVARTIQRRAEVAVPALRGPGGPAEPGRTPSVADAPPMPILDARAEQLGIRDGRPVVRFLNRERPLTVPMDWHPADLDGIANLAKMHLHYMEWSEALDDERWLAVVDDWIDANPPYRPGFWKGDWNSYAVSLRVVVWMQQLAARRLGRDDPRVDRAVRSVAGQLRFLARHLELDLGGNHLLKNLKALLWGAAFFDRGRDADAWRATAGRRLAAEIDEQILDDGMHFERSPAYHGQVVVDLLECLHVAAPGPLRDRLEDAVDRAAAALADLVHPDGLVSLFNDGGLHMTYAPEAVLAAVAGLRGRRPAARAVVDLPDAGYHGLRWDGGLALFDCGPIAPDFLPAHGHGDVLAFEWSVDGRRVVTDTGVFEYLPGPRRDRSRSTVAHNTVTLDDRDQAEFHGAFRVGRRPDVRVERVERTATGLRAVASHDGYRHLPGGPVHRREFRAEPDRVEVHDRIVGGAGQRAVARLLLAPGFDARPDERGARIRGHGLDVRLDADGAVDVVPAPWWPDFGVERATRCVEIALGEAPCEGRFRLVASR